MSDLFGFISGKPTYIYNPSKPFYAVRYEFLLKGDIKVLGIGLPNPSYPGVPITYFNMGGSVLHDILGYRFLDEEDKPLPYGYDNRQALYNRIKEMGAKSDLHPSQICGLLILGVMQQIIDAILYAHNLEAFSHLADLVEVSRWSYPTKIEDVPRSIPFDFKDHTWKLLENLCDIRDTFKDKSGLR